MTVTLSSSSSTFQLAMDIFLRVIFRSTASTVFSPVYHLSKLTKLAGRSVFLGKYLHANLKNYFVANSPELKKITSEPSKCRLIYRFLFLLRNIPVKWKVLLYGRIFGTPFSAEDGVEFEGSRWMEKFTEQSC